MSPSSTSVEVEVGGRQLKLSNFDKVYVRFKNSNEVRVGEKYVIYRTTEQVMHRRVPAERHQQGEERQRGETESQPLLRPCPAQSARGTGAAPRSAPAPRPRTGQP